jgi:hypothetical protein
VLTRGRGSEILVNVSTSSDKQPPSGGTDPAPKPSRRAFSPAYKLAIVAEYENAPNGEKGALLRREGLEGHSKLGAVVLKISKAVTVRNTSGKSVMIRW